MRRAVAGALGGGREIVIVLAGLASVHGTRVAGAFAICSCAFSFPLALPPVSPLPYFPPSLPPSSGNSVVVNTCTAMVCDTILDFPDSRTVIDSGGWPSPQQLEKPVDVSPFPMDIFPESIRLFIRQVSESMGCPPDLVGGSCLAAVSGALGTRRRIALKDGWKEWGVIWLALVADTGSMKSPGDEKAAITPLKVIHNEIIANRSPGAELKMTWTADATTEALAPALRDNPEGLLLVRDELTGFVDGMNQYKGKGSDRQSWLSTWSGSSINILRKGDYEKGPTSVPTPFVSIVGAMPPGQLDKMVSQESEGDGFLERFLFVFPDPVPCPKWSDADISPEVQTAWEQVIRRLHEIEGQEIVRLSPDAKKVWIEKYNSHMEEMSACLSEQMKGAMSKLKGYAARFTLLLHAVWSEVGCLEVAPETVVAAWKLVEYFKSHARKVYNGMDESNLMKQVTRITEKIKQKKLNGFTSGELLSMVKNKKLFPKPDSLRLPLTLLCENGYIREVKKIKTDSKTRGRPSDKYEVNPKILQSIQESGK